MALRFKNYRSLNYCKYSIFTNKRRHKSSHQWLERQLTDPYVEKAKSLNYRCRSAFKLLEIDEKHRILNPGDAVFDCGAAPGSWTQVAVQKTNSDCRLGNNLPKGTVISVDLLHIHPIEGAIILGGMDFTNTRAQQKIKSILSGKLLTTVLSDMAPNASGVKSLDQDRITDLCYNVLKFAILNSAQNGNLLVKLWDNANVKKLEQDVSKFYKHVKRIKPKASRTDSSEIYVLGKGFIKPE